MRSLTALALVSALTSTAAAAEEACTMEHAIYADEQSGYELAFRPAKPWELGGMISHVYELTMPGGRVLWGAIGSNMGTSRDSGSLFSGCDRPGPDDAGLTEAVIESCRIWHGVVYALVDGRADFVPFTDAAAPPSLLLSDIGRTIRYSGLVEGPGDEPWDQFFLKGCAQ